MKIDIQKTEQSLNGYTNIICYDNNIIINNIYKLVRMAMLK